MGINTYRDLIYRVGITLLVLSLIAVVFLSILGVISGEMGPWDAGIVTGTVAILETIYFRYISPYRDHVSSIVPFILICLALSCYSISLAGLFINSYYEIVISLGFLLIMFNILLFSMYVRVYALGDVPSFFYRLIPSPVLNLIPPKFNTAFCSIERSILSKNDEIPGEPEKKEETPKGYDTTSNSEDEE